MENPYKTPDASLDAPATPYVAGIFWKIFFFILMPMEVWSSYDRFTDEVLDAPLWWLCVSSVIYVVYLVGLFGFAFSKRIGNPRFWFSFLFIQVATDVYEISDMFLGEELDPIVMVSVLVVAVPLIGLTWWSTYKYSKVMESFPRKS